MSETIDVQPISHSLTPYSGVWNKAQAAHLLRRGMFGPTYQQIQQAVTDGMAATVANLLQVPAIGDPLAYHPDETVASFGTSWVNSVYPANANDAQTVDTARTRSLAAWMMERINKEEVSITEKMCLFWQNHFSATLSQDQRAGFTYFSLIREHCLGNFKQFVKEMTIEPNMLLFLNGASNNVFSPNENYARELLELFTIGKGPQIGSGDYTNYTEQDVAAGAKILTGYTVDGLRSNTEPQPYSLFIPVFHDNSAKTLSYHFGGQSVPNAGANEYSNYIDVIFNQDQVATYICTKIYRFFVNHDLTSTVLNTVIPDMVTTMIANNYDILPVMQELLSSEHFYDAALKGSVLKSPTDMWFSMFNVTGTQLNFPLATSYEMYTYMYYFCENMGQGIGFPPSVAGWPAFYQAPSFYKLWVNATHLKTRFSLAAYMTVATGLEVNGDFMKLDVLPFLDSLSDPSVASAVINDISDLFFPKPISTAQKAVLKYILLGGQPDFEWGIQYGEYQSDPGNQTFYQPVKSKVELVLWQVFQMPEFQTI